jgi:hypothetical protein
MKGQITENKTRNFAEFYGKIAEEKARNFIEEEKETQSLRALHKMQGKV